MSKLSLLQKILRLMAVLVLKKYGPRVVSVTGSVGKTSAKEAIFTVLSSRYRVRRNEKNYNNEIGIPLTIIGVKSGQSSPWGWLGVFLKWIAVMVLPLDYPEILILEMGADRPGDIDYLTSFIRSDVGVITDVSLSHIEFFKSLEEVGKEKGTLVKKLEEKNLAVMNIDNPQVAKLKEQLKANIITVGFSEEAEMRATDYDFIYSDDDKKEIKGLSFKLNYKGTTMPVRLNNVLAKHQIYAALIAAATGTWFELNLVEIAAALENFLPPCGRMNLIAGIKKSWLIDDTYNSSPTSSVAALEVLGEISASRKIAVMGDMLELGGETEKSHRAVARKFLEIKGEIFFAVGQRMQFAVEELLKNYFPKENIYSFNNPIEAGKKLKAIIQADDLILVKGSQGLRMEKVVEEIMAEAQKAEELLCRQNEEWKSKQFIGE
jgi:UDP-N-acetylmuramoyl-tripeptide--D-alanyl-D-alanine ligase